MEIIILSVLVFIVCFYLTFSKKFEKYSLIAIAIPIVYALIGYLLQSKLQVWLGVSILIFMATLFIMKGYAITKSEDEDAIQLKGFFHFIGLFFTKALSKIFNVANAVFLLIVIGLFNVSFFIAGIAINGTDFDTPTNDKAKREITKAYLYKNCKQVEWKKHPKEYTAYFDEAASEYYYDISDKEKDEIRKFLSQLDEEKRYSYLSKSELKTYKITIDRMRKAEKVTTDLTNAMYENDCKLYKDIFYFLVEKNDKNRLGIFKVFISKEEDGENITPLVSEYDKIKREEAKKREEAAISQQLKIKNEAAKKNGERYEEDGYLKQNGKILIKL